MNLDPPAIYVMIDCGAGAESAMIARKWQEEVLPHLCHPASTSTLFVLDNPHQGRSVEASVAASATNATPKLSEQLFLDLAKSDPRALERCLLEAEMSPGLRARGAEAAGKIADEKIAIPLLLRLLENNDPVVREASIYGLEHHLTTEVRARLTEIVNDPATTRGVREAAIEALNA